MLEPAPIRNGFNRAAVHYDQHAFLQREIADRLLDRLQWFKICPERILDLGCGTGGLIAGLQQRYPNADCTALDLAPAMLSRMQQRFPQAHAVAGSSTALPFVGESFQLVISNLSLQWANDPGAWYQECLRVLAPGGLFLFTQFGLSTLNELRLAWQQVDSHPHVHAFPDMHDLGDILLHQGWSDPVMDSEVITVTYPQLKDLCRDLQGIGATNRDHRRKRGLTTRTQWQALEQAYEQWREDGLLPARYEVIYGLGWKPEQPVQRQHNGEVSIPLSALKR